MLNSVCRMVSGEFANSSVDDVRITILSYIVPAIIAALVAIVCAIATSVITYKTTKAMIRGENKRLQETINNSKEDEKRRLSAEYISNERIRWIQELRNTMSCFRAHTTIVVNQATKGDYGKFENGLGGISIYLYEINEEASKIRLLLDPTEVKDDIIIKKVDSVIDAVTYVIENKKENEYYNRMDDLTKDMQAYLKDEWEKVKKEIREE